jgi:hypothetical protein
VALAKARQYLKLFEKYIVAPYAYNKQFKYYNSIVNVNIILNKISHVYKTYLIY